MARMIELRRRCLFLAVLASGVATAQQAPPASQAATPPASQSQPQPAPTTEPAQETQAPAEPESADARPSPDAVAEPAPDPVQAEFERLDRDGDGRITASENAADAKDRFDAMDTDHNYHVSEREMDDAQRPGGDGSIASQISGADAIRAMDPNGNGELSVSEHENAAEARFRGLDANADGVLDRDEMERSRPVRPAEAEGSGDTAP